MSMSAKSIIMFAGVSGALSVLLGAFAAHGLKQQISSEMLQVFQTGVKYQAVHATVMLFLGMMVLTRQSDLWSLAAVFIIVGTLLFSGSLYALALGGPKWLGPITPLGGICFISAWIVIVLAASKIEHP